MFRRTEDRCGVCRGSYRILETCPCIRVPMDAGRIQYSTNSGMPTVNAWSRATCLDLYVIILILHVIINSKSFFQNLPQPRMIPARSRPKKHLPRDAIMSKTEKKVVKREKMWRLLSLIHCLIYTPFRRGKSLIFVLGESIMPLSNAFIKIFRVILL